MRELTKTCFKFGQRVRAARIAIAMFASRMYASALLPPFARLYVGVFVATSSMIATCTCCSLYPLGVSTLSRTRSYWFSTYAAGAPDADRYHGHWPLVQVHVRIPRPERAPSTIATVVLFVRAFARY